MTDETQPLTRRQVLTILGAAAAGLATGAASLAQPAPLASRPHRARMPVAYVPHGGGPWPFMQPPMFDPREEEPLRAYLQSLPQCGPARPSALLVVSAHWEEDVPTVTTGERPPLIFDYEGFPPETYRLTWPAPGHPELARRVRDLLVDAGIPAGVDDVRGFDHGTFVPLKLALPDADVPVVQLSLVEGLDPDEHLRIGSALRPLREEGVLIVGSGMSFHDLRSFGSERGRAASETFDAWLREAVESPAGERDAKLARWWHAPSAREAHPREEHLLPLMVIAGAAGSDRGRVAYSDLFGGVRVSAFRFG